MELTSPESLNVALGRRHEASCLRRIELLEDSLMEARMELSGVLYRYGLKRKVDTQDNLGDPDSQDGQDTPVEKAKKTLEKAIEAKDLNVDVEKAIEAKDLNVDVEKAIEANEILNVDAEKAIAAKEILSVDVKKATVAKSPVEFASESPQKS